MTYHCYADVHYQFINVPKNASTSILALMFQMQSQPTVKIHEFANLHYREVWRENGPPSFTVVRHPWRRFVSTWRNKVYRPHRPDTNLIKMGCTPGMELYEFANWVLNTPESLNDPHLKPQHHYIPDGNVSILCQEDLDAGWNRIGARALYGYLPRLNVTRKDDIARTSLRGAIEGLYRIDRAKWNDAIALY